MENKLSAEAQAWAVPFKLKEGLSMRPIDVKRLLNLQHVTINECHLFLNKCKQYGADPFMNDMHMIKYSEKATAAIVTGVGFFQKKAAANPRFEGYGKTEWLAKGEGKTVLGTEKGHYWTDFWVPSIHGKYPLACRASCYIKGYKEAQTFVVNWDENVKTKDEWVNKQKTGKKTVNSTWDGMPSRMLEKDAIVGLLRQVLPSDLGGLYISEEITGDEAPEVKTETFTTPEIIEPEPEPEPTTELKIDGPTQEEIDAEFSSKPEVAPERSHDEADAGEPTPPGDWNEFTSKPPENKEEEIGF